VKPPLRTKSVGTKVSEAEFAMLEGACPIERANALGVGSGRAAVSSGRPGAKAGEVLLAEPDAGLDIVSVLPDVRVLRGEGW
jgi:hypothetical protein